MKIFTLVLLILALEEVIGADWLKKIGSKSNEKSLDNTEPPKETKSKSGGFFHKKSGKSKSKQQEGQTGTKGAPEMQYPAERQEPEDPPEKTVDVDKIARENQKQARKQPTPAPEENANKGHGISSLFKKKSPPPLPPPPPVQFDEEEPEEDPFIEMPKIAPPKWDRETALPDDTLYSDLPLDMRTLADNIDKSDAVYRDMRKTPQERCKAMVEIQKNLVPLMVAYNYGTTSIMGPDGKSINVKLQTGLSITGANYFVQGFLCSVVEAQTMLDPDDPKPVPPFW